MQTLKFLESLRADLLMRADKSTGTRVVGVSDFIWDELREQIESRAMPQSWEQKAHDIAQRLWRLPEMPKTDLIATVKNAVLEAMEWSQPKQPTELEMHRADYQACKDAGFESPGELLSAYNTLQSKADELKARLDSLRVNHYQIAAMLSKLSDQLELGTEGAIPIIQEIMAKIPSESLADVKVGAIGEMLDSVQSHITEIVPGMSSEVLRVSDVERYARALRKGQNNEPR